MTAYLLGILPFSTSRLADLRCRRQGIAANTDRRSPALRLLQRPVWTRKRSESADFCNSCAHLGCYCIQLELVVFETCETSTHVDIPTGELMRLIDYVQRATLVEQLEAMEPWKATESAMSIVSSIAVQLASDSAWYCSRSNLAIHATAVVSPLAILDAPAVIGPRARVSHGAYLRSGVWLDEDVSVGPNCEIKSSFIFAKTRIAHLNYVGNSIVGEDVNIEAGAVLANHWNERDDKSIAVRINGQLVETTVSKLGAIVGDSCRIGANAVTSPGTVLPPQTVVGRLELVDQSNS